ncbi:ATP-dependent nuclease [Streptomyces sp. NPDC101158]|uniref:ATP-dependent nuclease n=1 Tax=Streptomyces sp. NPDC101158 TaxID=3366117 RepID=UPI003809BEB6
MAEKLFEGLGISNYRSFGEEMQYSGPLAPVTLLAGQNNAGKSNFLKFLSKVAEGSISLTPLDRPQMPSPGTCRYARAYRTEDLVDDISGKYPPAGATFRDFLMHPSLTKPEDELTWIEFEVDGLPRAAQFDDVIKSLGSLQGLARYVGRQSYSGSFEAERRNAVEIIRPCLPANPLPVETIEAFRRIGPYLDESHEVGSHEGAGLLTRLQRLQNPPAETYHRDSEKFAAINRFLQNILDDDSALLEVQHDASVLNVHHRKRMLPLENLGTGIHQVVVLAVAATVLERTVVCIEEPEVHLHPILQRKFIQYLARETNNQYVIATHSAHLLDSAIASVIHVSHDGDHTQLTSALTPSSLSNICSDLGYRPSDLLQANAIIWVEGPSDRIYLKHWIEQQSPDLIEGLHYSIMFYGGGLLNQLTSLDEAVQGFIELRRLNRHLAIIIDSDKTYASKPINDTKKRIRTEFESGERPGFAWVTEGYTIENYVPADILRDAVAEVHPRSAPMEWDGGKWENPLSLKNGKGSSLAPDKNRIARTVCASWSEKPSPNTHLGKMIEKCIEFIEHANQGVERKA